MLSLVLASVLLLPLTGCSKKDDEGKIMTVELNPQVEFLLDANDKVVTVNATNDEGNYVIAKVDFVGMTAEEALNAFIKVSAEDGFLLEGEINAGENNLKISVSGDKAEKFYKEVKKEAENYIKTLDDIKVNFDFNEISKEEIEALVQDCMRELKVEEIQAKTQEELLKLLEESRKNTEDLLSQELKDYYYAERALEIRKAQLDAYIKAIQEKDKVGLATAFLTSAQGYFDNFTDAVKSYKDKYVESFLSVTSDYYLKMQELLAAKKELLQARIENATEETLEKLEATYELTLSAIESSKQFAQAQIDTVNDTINRALDLAETTLNTIIETLNITLEDLDATVTNAIEQTKNNFDKAFKDENGEYIANKYWNALAPKKQQAA